VSLPDEIRSGLLGEAPMAELASPGFPNRVRFDVDSVDFQSSYSVMAKCDLAVAASIGVC
jgi:hypothetical protein